MLSRRLGASVVLALLLASCLNPEIEEAFQVLDMVRVPGRFVQIGEGQMQAGAYRIYHVPQGSVNRDNIRVPEEAVPEGDADLRAFSRGNDWTFLGIWTIPNPSGSGHCRLRLALAKDADAIYFTDLSQSEKERVRSGEMGLVKLSASCIFA